MHLLYRLLTFDFLLAIFLSFSAIKTKKVASIAQKNTGGILIR